MEFVWKNQRPFNAYSNYMRLKYGDRIQKLSIDAGFSCPNRDGTISSGGCSFCSNDAFNPSYCRRFDSISVQIEEGIKFHKWRYDSVTKYLAYFQAYSNTYAPIELLKQKYNEALQNQNIVGLVIGTRPDCVDTEKLDYLANLNQKKHIVLEFGIESCYDKTLKAVNRGHNFETTKKAIIEANKRGLEVGGHIIFGFPTESQEEMLAQADILSKLPINNLKFHQLQILKGTAMAADYEANPSKYRFFTFDDYKSFIIRFLEKLNPNIIIERFASEVPPRYNVGPSWGKIRNEQIVQQIETQMIKDKRYQGKYYKAQ